MLRPRRHACSVPCDTMRSETARGRHRDRTAWSVFEEGTLLPVRKNMSTKFPNASVDRCDDFGLLERKEPFLWFFRTVCPKRRCTLVKKLEAWFTNSAQ